MFLVVRAQSILAFVALIFVTLIAFPAAAFAAEGDPNALQRVTDMAFEVLTPLLILFATWLAHRAVKTFEKKTGIDVPTAQEEQIDKWVDQGIHWAEEKSRSKIKAKEAKLTGPEKLEHAADFVLSFIEAKKYHEWTRDLVKGKVEAKLGVQRAAGEKPELDK